MEDNLWSYGLSLLDEQANNRMVLCIDRHMDLPMRIVVYLRYSKCKNIIECNNGYSVSSLLVYVIYYAGVNLTALVIELLN